jgi:DNA-binding transcriptional MocR family regulator
MGQRLVAACGAKGMIEERINKLRSFYSQKRDKILESLSNYFPSEVSWTEPEGGFYTWVELPTGMNSKELLITAIEEENVAFVSGGAFETDTPSQNAFRLSFSQPSLEEIEEGIYRLSKVIKKELSKETESQRCIG